MELRTNEDKLVEFIVLAETYSTLGHPGLWRIQPNGQPIVVPNAWGGMKLNVRVGDPATGWAADHTEPGVSVKNAESNDISKGSNAGLNAVACIGNEATVVSGDVKGKKGVVTGKHRGIEHVVLDFTRQIKEGLIPGDKIKIIGVGLGLKLLDWPGIELMNMSPNLLKNMHIGQKGDKLTVPVTHLVPAEIIGSGSGYLEAYTGDLDMEMFDKASVEKYGLEDLKLGDYVAILDHDHTFGYVYRPGAISISIVIHGDSVGAGHGPGLTTLFTSGTGLIEPVIDPKANIVHTLNLL